MWGSGSHLLQLSLRFFLSFNRFQNCFLWSHFQLQTLPPHHRKYHLSLQVQIGHWILAWLFQSGESRASFSVVFGVLVSCSWLNLVLQLLREAERPQAQAQHWWDTVVMRDTHKGQTAHLYSFKDAEGRHNQAWKHWFYSMSLMIRFSHHLYAGFEIKQRFCICKKNN